MCGNIVRSQRVAWFPLCAARHLHNLCNSYQEFDTVLNSDICTMLIDGVFFFGISMWTSLLVVQKNTALSSPHKHTSSCVHTHVAQCDPVCGALASGYLEVSRDAVSACGSGFIVSGLMGTCINLADSFAVRRKSFCGLSTFL